MLQELSPPNEKALEKKLRANEAYLVAGNRIPTVVDNNISVRFKDRYHLFLSRNMIQQRRIVGPMNVGFN